MFCEKCGNAISHGVKFCKNCGASVEEAQPAQPEMGQGLDKALLCTQCGNEIREGEKFCIQCGTPISSKRKVFSISGEGKALISGIQEKLVLLFQLNPVMAFFAKYAQILVLYFPIYLLMTKIEALDSVTDVMQGIYPIGFYGYYVSLIILFGEKRYLSIAAVVVMRLINTVVYMIQGYSVLASLCSVAIYVTSLAVLFRLLSKTGEYAQIKKSLHLEAKMCPGCGSNVKSEDRFCPKCGSKV